MNVERWFELEESRKLEDQVKYFIASTVEGYLNGCYDAGYEAMTKREWIDYVWKTIEYEKDITVNGVERKHLWFYGKSKTEELTTLFIENYKYVKPYIKKMSPVLYLCNRRKCDDCSYPICKHTEDIRFAKNFTKQDVPFDLYVETKNKIEEILTYLGESHILLREGDSTDKLTDNARRDACYHIEEAVKILEENNEN